jgi:RNA polymerase sigma-70 factor (ECF subfamily)
MQDVMDRSNMALTAKCWVELYSDDMYSWALHKTGSKETAEDIVQESFLAAVQSFEKFAGDSQLKTWLFAILNNKINDHFRRMMKTSFISMERDSAAPFDGDERWKIEERPGTWTRDDGHLLDDESFVKVLEDCIGELPDTWSAAIRLKYLEEASGDAICQEIGISTTNFWQVLHRARLRLRKCLEIYGFKR